MDKRTIIYLVAMIFCFYLIQHFLVPKTSVPQEIVSTSPIEKPKVEYRELGKPSEEKFYVLENAFQQIVFSNIGGSIAEINLVLKNKDNKSIINAIGFDEIMQKDYEENDTFPQNPYYTFGFKKHEKGTLGKYYPLLRRSIYTKNRKLINSVPPKYYSLNIISETADTASMLFEVTNFDKNSIQFTSKNSSHKIVKTFSLTEAPYVVDLKVDIDGDTKGLYITSGVPEVELTSNASVPELRAKMLKGTKTTLDNLKLPKTSVYTHSNFIDWISNSNGYFGIIIDPLSLEKPGYITEYIPGNAVPSRITVIDAEYNLYPPQKYPGYMTALPIASNSMNFRIFAGPYQDQILSAIDAIYKNPLKGYNPSYVEVKTSKGWFSFASEPFAKFLLLIMRLFYSLTHSWGFSIILLTIVFRVMLYPLNAWSIKSTLRMQEVTPLLKVIDAKYKKDPKRANLEKMKLFKEKGANPLSGCLPVLIQMPFLLGMFSLLRTSFDLRGVSFIPGWIDNLTAPDVLFSWSHPIFLIGNSFHLLPVLVGIVMFIQSKMNMKVPEDKSKMTDQQKQQVMMNYLFPVILTVLFYKAASGLNIYFFFSMLLGIVQQWYMSKIKNKTPKLTVRK